MVSADLTHCCRHLTIVVMADTSGAAQKRTVIEALVLAFAHSEAREMVGTDALRSVLEVEYYELVSDGVINLQPLWELLEQQPGFDAEKAKPPICIFKSWQRRLTIEVKLPDSLQGLTQQQEMDAAAACPVPRPELNAVFRGISGLSAAGVPVSPGRADPPKDQRIAKDETPKRPMVAAVAGVVGAICLAFAGFTLYRTCDTPTGKWKAIAPVAISSDIPIASADRLGKQVRVTLSDDKWLALPKDDRRVHLETALRKLDAREIESLVILDRAGKARADARFLGRTGTLKVTFR